MSTYFCLQKMKLRMCSVLYIFHTRLTNAGNLLWVLEFNFSYFLIELPIVIAVFTYYQICSRILSTRGRDEGFENMFIRKDSSSAEPPSQLFIDAAVYSRNRCFRLALSSKAGKNSVLLPTERFKCKDMVCHLPWKLIQEFFRSPGNYARHIVLRFCW